MCGVKGVRFTLLYNKLEVVIPAGVRLPDAWRRGIQTHRREIRDRLRPGGITVADILKVFPTAMIITPQEKVTLCPHCGKQQWWISRSGIQVCARCYPPQRPDLVQRWISEQPEGKRSA